MSSTKARLPRILCIGAQKAGTSWLNENLAMHPNIWVPPFKEQHFFDFKFVEDSKKWARWHVKSNVKKLLQDPALVGNQRSYIASLRDEPILNGNWYKRVYAPMPEGALGLDVTPEYCAVPIEGINFIKKFLSDPLIIYIVRNPIRRALSQIRMNMNRKNADFSDSEAWLAAASDPVIALRGDYRTYIPAWDEVFPNALYIPFGEIALDPLGLLRRIEQFCGLPAASYPRAHQAVFETVKRPAPAEVTEYLAAAMSKQTAFLQQRFSNEFCSRT